MGLVSNMFIGEHGAAKQPAGTGTVASVGLTAAAALFAVTGSPVTTSGTLDLALNTQTANTIFVGPATGAAAVPTFRALVAADLSTTGTADATTFLRGDMTWVTPPSSAGTVTSVSLSLPSFITVTGSPVTGAGTLTGMLATQTANTIFAGPTTGAAAAPTFRALVAADLSTTGTANSTTFLRGDLTWATPPSSAGTVTSVSLSLPSFITVTGSPVTGAGTLTGTLATQTANTIFAGPTTGAAAAPTFRALVAADLSTTGTADSSTFLRGDMTWATPAGAGTVTSVALSLPSFITVSGSPVTTTGTLTGTLATQTANTIFAGPTTGAAAAPTFRVLVAADLSTTGTADATTFLRGDMTWATPPTGSGTVTSVALSLPSFFTVSGSPVTTTGTLTGTLATQTANTIFAGPTTGAAAAPTFRALVAADLSTTGTADATTFLRGDMTWASPTVTTVSDATFRIQDNTDATKQIAFEALYIATATTRTITVPDRNVTLDQLTVNTTIVAGGSANRLLQQSTTGNLTHQSRLSFYLNRFGFRTDGAVAADGIFDVTVGDYNSVALNVHHTYVNLSTGMPAGNFTVGNSVATSAAHDVLLVTANAQNTPTTGFGVRVLLRAESSTTTNENIAGLSATWSTATHASRTSRFSLSLVNNAAALAEVFRVDASGLLTSYIDTTLTSSVVEGQRITLATSGTPAAGLGVYQTYALESSTTADVAVAQTFARWTDPTHASYTGMWGVIVYDGTGLSGSSTTPNFAVSSGGAFTQNVKTATTNATVTMFTRALDTTGVAAAGFGLRDLIQLDTNATPGVSAAAFDTTWIDAVAGTHTAQYAIYLADTGALTERYRFLNGGLDLRMTTGRLYINGTQVLTNRITGWAAATGTKTRSTFDTTSVTLPELAERVAAIIDDNMTHGFFGT